MNIDPALAKLQKQLEESRQHVVIKQPSDYAELIKQREQNYDSHMMAWYRINGGLTGCVVFLVLVVAWNL